MRYTFIISFICFANYAKAADTLVTKLINTIYLEQIDTSAKYYNLYEFGKNPELDKYTIKDVQDDYADNKFLKEIPFTDFVEAIQNDTSSINWRNYDLKKAKCADKPHLPKYSTSVRIIHYYPLNTPDSTIKRIQSDGWSVVVLVKPHMSKKALNKARELAIANYENRPSEEKLSYFFSKPIFSKDRKYVLIGLDKPGTGCLYIYKLSGGKWIKLLTFHSWVA